MKFRFCGDLDCPDWVLAEINILARLTSVKMKLLVVQVIKALLGEEIDMKKVEKITADAKYEQGDVKASIAGIRFIISSAAKNDVDDDTLSSELQQLGLPKEHATALCKTYENKLATLRQEFRRQSFRRSSKLSNVTWKIVDSGNKKEERTVRINMELKANSGSMETNTFETSQEKLCLLLNELKLARSQMRVLDSS